MDQQLPSKPLPLQYPTTKPTYSSISSHLNRHSNSRLVLTRSIPKDERIEYCALRYSWGRSSALQLLQDNLETLPKRIDTLLLSQNIQHAIVEARNLRFKYIWVDLLCIIQGSLQDWRPEAAKMGDVYTGAFLTIGASGSNSGDDGCLHESDTAVFKRCDRSLLCR